MRSVPAPTFGFHRLVDALAAVAPLLMVLLLLAHCSARASGAAGERVVVRSQADLPAYSYALEKKPSELLDDDAACDALASQLRSNLEALLAGYDIRDKATLAGAYATLRNLALLCGDADAALDYGSKVRALQEKPADKLLSGLRQDAYAAAIAAGIDLPNVLTAGGVDRAGDEVGFTSYGRLVRVHANAHEIDNVMPGGRRMHWSGTSMAAPQVTNLAAKLWALDPSLTVADVVGLILDGAERSEGGRRNLINPKRSVELFAQRRR